MINCFLECIEKVEQVFSLILLEFDKVIIQLVMNVVKVVQCQGVKFDEIDKSIDMVNCSQGEIVEWLCQFEDKIVEIGSKDIKVIYVIVMKLVCCLYEYENDVFVCLYEQEQMGGIVVCELIDDINKCVDKLELWVDNFNEFV